MIKKANKLIILDHHKSAEEDLKNIPDKNKIFKMDHSGAYITWCYFHSNQNIPKLILYVEDNDIWTKKLPNTNEISSILYLTKQTFEEYEKFLDDDYITNDVTLEGAAILNSNNNTIEKYKNYSVPKFMCIGKKYYFVCYLNSNVHKSELGNIVFDVYQNINFSAIYNINDITNSTYFSLRSTDKSTDVSKIAKFYGGGGHRNASAINVQYLSNTIPGIVYDEGSVYNILKTIYYNSKVINDKKYNIVYLNTSIYKKQLANYLLQERYINNNDASVQESISIITNRDNYSCDIFDMSCVWNYDGGSNKTYVILCINNIADKKEIIEYFEEHISLNISYNDNNILNIIIDGLHIYL